MMPHQPSPSNAMAEKWRRNNPQLPKKSHQLWGRDTRACLRKKATRILFFENWRKNSNTRARTYHRILQALRLASSLQSATDRFLSRLPIQKRRKTSELTEVIGMKNQISKKFMKKTKKERLTEGSSNHLKNLSHFHPRGRVSLALKKFPCPIIKAIIVRSSP